MYGALARRANHHDTSAGRCERLAESDRVAGSRRTRAADMFDATSTDQLLLVDRVHDSGSLRQALAVRGAWRSEEHTSELQSLMRISYAVFCLKKKKKTNRNKTEPRTIKITMRTNYIEQKIKS